METSADGKHRLVTRRRMPAPREIVYPAWIDPAGMREWMCPGDALLAEAVRDVRVGGWLHIVMKSKNQVHEHTGTDQIVDPPAKIRFTWSAVESPGEITLVTVEFIAHGDESELVITHEGFTKTGPGARLRNRLGRDRKEIRGLSCGPQSTGPRFIFTGHKTAKSANTGSRWPCWSSCHRLVPCPSPRRPPNTRRCVGIGRRTSFERRFRNADRSDRWISSRTIRSRQSQAGHPGVGRLGEGQQTRHACIWLGSKPTTRLVSCICSSSRTRRPDSSWPVRSRQTLPIHLHPRMAWWGSVFTDYGMIAGQR
jgi:uncharacterized protein YndB with AHSA1/START domain